MLLGVVRCRDTELSRRILAAAYFSFLLGVPDAATEAVLIVTPPVGPVTKISGSATGTGTGGSGAGAVVGPVTGGGNFTNGDSFCAGFGPQSDVRKFAGTPPLPILIDIS